MLESRIFVRIQGIVTWPVRAGAPVAYTLDTYLGTEAHSAVLRVEPGDTSSVGRMGWGTTSSVTLPLEPNCY
jgi:hypothetical protein